MKLNHVLKNEMTENEWNSLFARERVQAERVPKPKCCSKRNLISAVFKQQRAGLFVPLKSSIRVKFRS
jgi:hypothetical protein